jgi:hypothetical protein
MTTGFIIIRNIRSYAHDLYWRECYKCIRKYYDNPILIVDTGSNKNYITENIKLVNTTTIYHECSHYIGEILGYYYFWKLKPFDQAVILQDSVFIQKQIDFSLTKDEHAKILWKFEHRWDQSILSHIHKFISSLDKSNELLALYDQKTQWHGCFGQMVVIKWEFIDLINTNHNYFQTILPLIKEKLQGCALERITGLLIFYNSKEHIGTLFEDIHKYCRWGLTYNDYQTRKYNLLPIVKIWNNRQ